MRPRIGDTLRAARRAGGTTLADAAEATRVRESYLAALEEEDFAALGDDVYVRGFLRSYARFLGLDPEPLLEAYREGTAEPERRRRPARRARRPARVPRPTDPDGAVRRPPRERPPGTAVLLLLVLVVLLALAYLGLRDGGTEAPSAAALVLEVRR